ncbi:MAG: tRNA (adenosine(37)-N6)-threonylcarbamoyltransferase complex dimerization subunit type 1 TsaB [bacterium]|nr:tRNA (adenosine(37)-N6)-threonylcarbamoyltransferase complex dimerization subunit type 1 TsaB [bacterium]
MLILGLDTSTTTGGVAIISDQRLIANYQLDVTATHSARLFPAISAILHDAQLTLKEINGIAVATGPGSFTGLRIGVATAKSLAYLNKIPLVGISTLDALAHPFIQSNQLICPILDALRGEVYTAVYQADNGNLEKIIADIVGPVSSLLEQIKSPCLFTGNGIAKYKTEIETRLGTQAVFAPINLQVVLPSSIANLGLLKISAGNSDDPLKLEPHYLRRPEAEIVWEKKQTVSRKQ